MELLNSIRIFLRGFIRWLFLLVPFILVEIYELIRTLTHIKFEISQWFAWLLFILGWIISSILAFHDYRVENNLIKITWIEKYKKEHHNKLPVLPDYLLQIVNSYTQGTPISKTIKLITPDQEYWEQLLPSKQDELREFVEWLGQDSRDFIEQIKRTPPKSIYETRGPLAF